jgi:hypothetical protein
MKKTVLTYGLISGAIAAALMLAHLPFADHGAKGLIFGYTGIILSSLLVFFGVRSYRENVGAGKISFGRGLAVGVLIALISATCYVATWELVNFKLAPGLGDKMLDQMLASQVEKLKASGAGQDKIDATVSQAESFKKLYGNPLVNAAMTYIEPFPIGLAMALISAAILRRK